MEKQNELVQAVYGMGLQKPKVDSLMQGFTGYFSEARKIVDGCKDIVVSDEKQVDLMKQARESRLKLKEIRVNCEKTRKELKEQSLRESRAIDGIANVIKALIVPIEEHLEKQERFAEVQEQMRREKQLTGRIEELSKYVGDVSLYSLKDMDDEVFNNLLAGCKLSWEKARDDEAKAEAERVAKIKAEKEEQEKIRVENEKLKRQAEEKERLAEVERQKQAEILRKANEATEKAEAKLKAEKEAQVKKEAEQKAIEEAKKKEVEETERRAVLAPDKVKLVAFADNIDEFIDKYPPALKSESAQKILNEAEKLLRQASEIVRRGVKTL